MHGDFQGNYKRRSLDPPIQVDRGDACAVWHHLQSRGKQVLSANIADWPSIFTNFLMFSVIVSTVLPTVPQRLIKAPLHWLWRNLMLQSLIGDLACYTNDPFLGRQRTRIIER